MISLDFLLIIPTLFAVVDAACPSTSVAGIPGCWGQPACAYVVAKALGPGAACKFDYCNCGGTNVPLLATTVSGTPTIGCGGYTTQPTANNCPTAAASAGLAASGNTPPIGSQNLPNGATVITSSSGSVELSELYVPTIYPAYSSLTSTSTIVTTNSLSQSTTLVVGPSGVAWIPASASASGPRLPPPTNLPTVVDSLASTVNSAKVGSSSGSVIQSSSGHVSGSSLQIAPSSASSSSSANGKDSISGRSLTSSSSSALSLPMVSDSTSRSQSVVVTAVHSSYTEAFASTAPQLISLLTNDNTEIYSKTTLSAFTTISKPATVTEAFTITPKSGQPVTTSSAIIIGPGGVWWTNIFGGGGGGGGGCVWPFCPQPNTPTPNPTQGGSNIPTQGQTPSPTASPSSQVTTSPTSRASTSESQRASSSSSCTTASTVSDCSVTCSTASGVSTSTCATSCYSTISGCGVSGTTISSSSACSKLSPWTITGSTDWPSETQSQATSTITPSCIADGAPWFSPTSWCNCGSSSRYPTLSPTSGASTANCAYTALPSTTIQPVSTSAAPTNIPGVGGVPACHAILAAPGTSAYCDCGGTPAPTLSPTSSNFMNCAYTIVPTSPYNPKIRQSSTSKEAPPPTKSDSPPRYATGQCGIHVREGAADPGIAFSVSIVDANKNQIGSLQKSLTYGQSMDVDSALPYVLVITSNKAPPKSRLFRRGPPGTDQTNGDSGAPDSTQKQNPYDGTTLTFSYGADTWNSNDKRCSVGKWDLGNVAEFLGTLIFGDSFQETRQMDCSFACPAPTKRSIELRDHENTEIGNFISSNISTLYKRVDRTAQFKQHAKDGKRLWDVWNGRSEPDKRELCDNDIYGVFTEQQSYSAPSGSEGLLLKSEEGIRSDENFISSTLNVHGTEGKEEGTFSNQISPKQGAFLARNNYQLEDKTKRAFDASAIYWWQWRKSVTTILGTQDYSSLKTVWRMSIANPATIATLDAAVPLVKRMQVSSFKPDDTDLDNNPFWAILGTDNGKGIIYMLTDYKQALRQKAITEIKAKKINGTWYFWALLG